MAVQRFGGFGGNGRRGLSDAGTTGALFIPAVT
jgi:hypothetical protein